MTKFDFTRNTLSFGDINAEQSLTAIINLGCTDSRDWFNQNIDDLTKAASAGKLLVHLKFWNKDKEPLQKGNQANGFIDFNNEKAALGFVKAVFANQDPLNDAPDVAAYLKATYGLDAQPTAQAAADATAEEVAANGITSLPTIVFEDKLYFDDQLSELPDFA